MALRIPWDKQETALLIDAFLHVKNKELSQQEAVKEVSILLRRRSILSGMEIDDVFRNINGITMQMQIIGGLMNDRPSSLHSATKMFNEMVALYKSDPAAFHEILIQAKGECAMQVNVQEIFFAWLKAKVSSVQLSEFYIVCKDIESFCMSKRILTEPLFETTNTVIIQGVIDTIKSNRMFQLRFFRHLGKMRKVMDYYMTFLQEVPLQQNKEPEKVPAPNEEIVTHSEEQMEAKNTVTPNTGTVVVTEQDEITVSVHEEENTLPTSDADSMDDIATDEVVASEGNNDSALVWNFANDNVDFSKATPITISYFDEQEKVQGWADTFVKIIRAMQEDYPSIIRGMVGYRFAGIGKVALTGIAGIGRFNEPVELNNGLYLETDCSPDEIVSIVRFLMDKCNMDYDNIEIYYEESEPVDITTESQQEDEIKKNRMAFIAWAQSQQMQKAAILAYLSDIKKCSDFAQENDYIKEGNIFLIQDANILEQVFWKMRKDHRFVELNNERRKRPVSAMNKLIEFRRATTTGAEQIPAENPVKRSVLSVATSSVDPPVRERYTAVLAENFVDGFRPSKAIDRNRFRMYYSDMFGQELTEEDEQLVCTLMKVGTLRDERIFVKDETEQKDLLEEINDTIMEAFKGGASCIYLDCLFAKFQEQLAETLHIYNVDSLESILFSSRKRNYSKRYNYLFGYSKEPAPARDVVAYMENSHLPVTYSEIENGLWYIPLDKIKNTLVTTPGIVNVASEAYLYAPNLPVSGRELQQIAELIRHALLQRSYISDVELMHLIEEHCPSVLMNTPDYPMWGLRNALAYLLREQFSFRGAIISDRNEEISMAEVFSDFCRRSEHITVDELRNFAGELNTVIYWDSVYGEMVRVNQNEFVRRDQITFDIEQTDSVLDSLIQSAYTPIKTINLFLHFPAIDVPWNHFVLESYVANYSRKFRLLHASYTATDCYGAIVRQESGISDYRTLIVEVLAKNTGWKNKNDALQLLVDRGYQQRRSYSDIEKVMQEAKARRSAPKK